MQQNDPKEIYSEHDIYAVCKEYNTDKIAVTYSKKSLRKTFRVQ